MGAATEFGSPHRRDAAAYLSTVEDLITYLWTGDGLRLGATIAFEFGPDPGEREWRAIIIEREPHNVLSRLTDCALSDALCSSVLRLGRPKGQNNR